MILKKPFLLLLAGLLLLTGCSRSLPEPARLQGQIFGTFWLVTLPGDWTDQQVAQLDQGIQQQLQQVDASMSTYRQDSELNQLNAMPVGEWMNVSPALFEVLQISQSVSEASQGAFDVTVGGLVNLWGFGPDERSQQMPSDTVLQQALAETGYQYLQLNADRMQVRRLRDSYLDLSAVAKGYAVDQVAAWLRTQGASNFLVNIGGDLIVGGERAENRPWRIGVEVPDSRIQAAQHIFEVRHLAVATSGDYRNYYEVDGQRLSHTLDPRTGRPIAHQLASATVLHPSAALADAWATAFMVLGADEASRQLAIAQQLPVLLISRQTVSDGWDVWASPALLQLLGPEQAQQLTLHP